MALTNITQSNTDSPLAQVVGAGTFSGLTGAIPASANPSLSVRKFSTSSLTPGGNAGVFNYIAPSALTMPAVYTTAIGVGTVLRWYIRMSKTNAGSGAFNIRMHLGTTADTNAATLFTQSLGTATAAVDDMDLEIILTFTSATAAYWSITATHSAASGTGFGLAVGSQAFSGTLSGLTTTTASLIFGISYSNTTGTAVITVPQVQAEAIGVS